MVRQYTAAMLKKAIEKKGHRWLDDGKPYLLNLVGIRRNTDIPNSFDDVFAVAYSNGSIWKNSQWQCTTDPGLFWLRSPMNVKGCAILKPGQYVDAWVIGKHQGQYDALVQCGPVTVIRDADRDSHLDFGAKLEDTGLFGINIHRANATVESVQVDRWSAGCTVLANPLSFATLMKLAFESRRLGRKAFSYTLLEEKDF